MTISKEKENNKENNIKDTNNVLSSTEQEKQLPDIRKASELTITFPQNKNLELNELDNIQSSINKGGIVTHNKCYINTNNIKTLLATDKKGSAKVYNNAPEKDKFENGKEQFLSVSEIKKNIDVRIQEPRETLEHEKLKYAENCLNSFRDSYELQTERHIEADRIKNDRPLLTQKKMKQENITDCQLSSEKFDNDARGHHIERVCDTPSKARDLDNIVVIKEPIHQDIHKNGTESPDELKEYIQSNEYQMPKELKPTKE